MFVELSKHRDTNLCRFQIWRFFFGPAPPPPHQIRQCDSPPPPTFLFRNGPPTSNRAISREKRRSIYQGLLFVEYSSNQILAYIGVTKKKLCSFCLQRTTCITHENEARNRNTSIRSQMILEFLEHVELKSYFFSGQLIQTSS